MGRRIKGNFLVHLKFEPGQDFINFMWFLNLGSARYKGIEWKYSIFSISIRVPLAVSFIKYGLQFLYIYLL